MNNAESLVKTTLAEIEKVLTTKTVVGDAVNVEGVTIIPLISAGFGFGAGAGSGEMKGKEKGGGAGGGSAGGAGVKPVAIIVIDKDGVRIESIMGGVATAIEKMGEAIPRMVERFLERKREGKREG